jgi:hypothetical protein
VKASRSAAIKTNRATATTKSARTALHQSCVRPRHDEFSTLIAEFDREAVLSYSAGS